MPTIEPVNDEYLTSFGRGYLDAKNRAIKKSKISGATNEGDASGITAEDISDVDDHDFDNSSFSGAEEIFRTGVDDENEGGEKLGSRSSAAKNASATTPKVARSRRKHGVFVVNLPYALCDQDKLQKIFAGFGQIAGVVLTRPTHGKA